MMTNEYAAGYFDGEGSITISYARQKRFYRIVVQIGTTDSRIVKLFHKRWGGSINTWNPRKPNRKLVWNYRVTGHKANNLVTDLLPHLVIKRKAALILIQFHNTVRGQGSYNQYNRMPSKIRQLRHKLIDRLRALNCKGRTEHIRSPMA